MVQHSVYHTAEVISMYQWYDADQGVMVVYIALPAGVNECCTPNADGSYTVFINSGLSEDRQMRAYRHALWHIKNDDFYKDDVQIVEGEAHAAT